MNRADKLAEALRALPDDADMIEHNPDEGMRLFCCDGEVHTRFSGSDFVTHSADCWYAAARAALAEHDAAPEHPALAFADYCEHRKATARTEAERIHWHRLQGNARKASTM